MKYYIVGKKTKEGTLEDDAKRGRLSEYFELGWEYLCSHLRIKHLFVAGRLKKDAVIVTIKDRMFLYQGFWNNVLSYDDFIAEKREGKRTIDYCDIIEKLRRKKRNEEFLPQIVDGRYEHWDSDKDIIKNIKYVNIPHLQVSKPYCCLHLRYRKFASCRNLSKEFWEKVIKKIKLSDLNIYIFGKDAEEFANGRNTFHVNLDEYASLLNNENCRFLIGSMSGGTLVAQTFSHKNCKNYVIITDQKTLEEYRTYGAYRVFYHIKEMNFSGAPIIYVSNIENNDDVDLISADQLMSEI